MALPSGYTQLEYIQSSGTQYIDTGVVPTVNTKVSATAETFTTPSNNEWLFGSRVASGSGRFSVFRNSATQKWGFGFGGSTTENYTSPMICTLDVYVDGTSCTINGETSALTGTLSSTRSIYIFMENRVGVAEQGITAKLFTFKIWDGDTLVRDYVPVLRNNDNVAGLYDLQNNVFYVNAGSGVFTYPGYVEPVEGHNTLIDGAAYAITGGKVLVNGAVYDVAKGKTMVGGTVYDIKFAGDPVTLTITGTIDTVRSYVSCRGVTYKSLGTYVIENGPVDITFHGYVDYNSNVFVILNGTNVYSEYVYAGKSWQYTFTTTSNNVEIKISKSGSRYLPTITM